AGLWSGNSAENLRATPSTAMVSAGAAPAQHAIAAMVTSRNRCRDRLIGMPGAMLDMIFAVGLHMVASYSGFRDLSVLVARKHRARSVGTRDHRRGDRD